MSVRVSPLGMKSATHTGRSASFQLIVPSPVPVLSLLIDAVSAFSNIPSGFGGSVDPSSTAVASATDTLWVSVRSGSSKLIVPDVGTLAVRSPPGTLVPPENAIVGGAVDVILG